MLVRCHRGTLMLSVRWLALHQRSATACATLKCICTSALHNPHITYNASHESPRVQTCTGIARIPRRGGRSGHGDRASRSAVECEPTRYLSKRRIARVLVEESIATARCCGVSTADLILHVRSRSRVPRRGCRGSLNATLARTTSRTPLFDLTEEPPDPSRATLAAHRLH